MTIARRLIAAAPLLTFAAALSVSAPAVANSLDTALIKRIIARKRTNIRACYDTTLQTQPDAAGKMVVKFSIAANGRVTEASATGMDETLCACMADVFRAMVFPKGPGLIHISYPFTFAPTPPAVPAKKTQRAIK